MTNALIIESVWRELHDYQLGSSVIEALPCYYFTAQMIYFVVCFWSFGWQLIFFFYLRHKVKCVNSHLSFEYERDRLQSGAYVQIASCHNAFNQRHQMIYIFFFILAFHLKHSNRRPLLRGLYGVRAISGRWIARNAKAFISYFVGR